MNVAKLHPNPPEPVACDMDIYESIAVHYRKNKARRTGTPVSLACGRKAKYSVNGMALCRTHAALLVLDLITETHS